MQDAQSSPPQAPKEDPNNGDILGFQAIAEVYFNWENNQHAKNELFLKKMLNEQAQIISGKYEELQRTLTREAMKNYADIIEPKSRACIANVMDWQSSHMSSEKMKTWSKGFVKEFEKEKEKNYLRKAKSTHTIWFQKLLANLETKQKEERISKDEEKAEKRTIEQILEELANKKMKDKNQEKNQQEKPQEPEEDEKEREGNLKPEEVAPNSQEQGSKKKRKNKKKKKVVNQETKNQEKEEKKAENDLTIREKIHSLLSQILEQNPQKILNLK